MVPPLRALPLAIALLAVLPFSAHLPGSAPLGLLVRAAEQQAVQEQPAQQQAGQQQQQQAAASPAPAAPAAPAPPPWPPSWCSEHAFPSQDMHTSMQRNSASFKVYHNVYWHTGKWYAVLPLEQANDPPLEEGLSVNTAVIRLPSSDASNFTSTIKACYLPGTTLLVDFPFPAFPDNNGHWAEIMLPTHSVLLGDAWRKMLRGASAAERPHLDRVLLVNLRRHVNEFFKEIMTLSLAPGAPPGQATPPIVDMTDLDGYDKLGWLVFENMLVIQDRYTHPDRMTGFISNDHGDLWRHDGCERFVDQAWNLGFAQPQHGQEFRSTAYRRLKWPEPQPWGQQQQDQQQQAEALRLPRQLTLLTHHEDYPQISNTYELMAMLRRVAAKHGLRMNQVSLSTDAPFASHVDTFGRSALVVGRHGPLMAGTVFMQPGSALLELLPYKWEWRGISQLYHNMTRSLGDIHHYAWRPTQHTFCDYKEKNDSRYHRWTPEECSARECLMVHARAGLVVDTAEVEALLGEVLPGVLAGRPVAELRRPWPKAA